MSSGREDAKLQFCVILVCSESLKQREESFNMGNGIELAREQSTAVFRVWTSRKWPYTPTSRVDTVTSLHFTKVYTVSKLSNLGPVDDITEKGANAM